MVDKNRVWEFYESTIQPENENILLKRDLQEKEINLNLKRRTKAEIALICAAVMWGLTFPFIRIVIKEITPLQLVFFRGLFAALIFLPFVLLSRVNRDYFFKTLPIGALLGILYFTSYYTQSIGLQTIPSGRSAFITNLSVIFVPFLSPFFRRGWPSRNDAISCMIAMVGIYFLTNPFRHAGLKPGDFYTIITAISFSFQIHILQWAVEKNPFPTLYAFWQVAFIGLFSGILLPFSKMEHSYLSMSPLAILSLIYLILVGMVLTTWLQSRYQSDTTPERATVIYIIEPIFACFFGYLILNESMSMRNLFGGFLIIVAVLWTYILKFFIQEKNQDDLQL